MVTAATFDKITAKRKLEEIFALVKSELKNNNNNFRYNKIGLYDGNMGIALFLYEYAKYDQSTFDENCSLIARLVEEAFSYIGECENLPRSFCNGLIGALCIVNLVKKKKILKIDSDYVSEEIIEYLEAGSLNDTLQNNNCDLLHGGFGFLFYLIENVDLPNWLELIENQLYALNKIAVSISEDEMSWKINSDYLKISPLNKDPNGVNLGLPHGISGIIILLAKLKKIGYSTNQIDVGIEKGMNLILSTKLRNDQSTSLYPTLVLNNKPTLNGRLAWCYGDFCIALAAWHSWQATGNVKYRDVSLEIVDHAANLDPKNAHVDDCGICHGTAGISHIFRKFYWETNNEAYKNAANFWIDQTLNMAKYTDGYVGYKVFRLIEHGGPSPELGLLEGVSGIGLALISALTNKKGDWDNLFLIN